MVFTINGVDQQQLDVSIDLSFLKKFVSFPVPGPLKRFFDNCYSLYANVIACRTVGHSNFYHFYYSGDARARSNQCLINSVYFMIRDI